MTKLEREIERELVTLYQSFGRNTVFEISGVPHVEYVRSHEPADADDTTIYVSGLNDLSLALVAQILARKFGSVL